MSLDIWPLKTLWPTGVQWSRTYAQISGGTSLNGDEQNIVSDGGGRWSCNMTVELIGAEAVKLARALISGTRGGTIPLIVPYFADAEAPYPLGVAPDDVPHSDGTPFSDGALYTTSGISVTASAASMGGYELTISPVTMGDLIGGEAFSIDHATALKRLYTVARVLDGNVIQLGEPLREDIPDGTVLDFGTPGCVMKLKNYDTAMSPVVAPWRATLTAQFQECLAP